MSIKGKYKLFEIIYFCFSFIFLMIYGIYHIDKLFAGIFVHLFMIIIHKLELNWKNKCLLNFFVRNLFLTKALLVMGPIYFVSPFVFGLIMETKVDPIMVFALCACCTACFMTYFDVMKEKE